MVDIAQGTSPLQTQTVVLDSEATKSASDELSALLSNAPKRRGRPPGSKNKPKTDEFGNFLPPGQRKAAPTDQSEEARARAKIAAKQARAVQHTETILNTLNDQIMGLLISQGVPQEWLFNKGHGPSSTKQVNPAYTPLAQTIAIPKHVATLAGMTWAEAEGSAIGDTIMKTVNADSPLRLVVLGVATVLVAVPWLNSLNEVRKQVNQLQEAKAQYDAQQQQANAANVNPVNPRIVG